MLHTRGTACPRSLIASTEAAFGGRNNGGSATRLTGLDDDVTTRLATGRPRLITPNISSD